MSAQLALLSSSAAAVAPVWGFGGSRLLSAEAAYLASAAAAALLRSGVSVVTGCCTGADACALSAACNAGLAERVSVLSAFGELPGSGCWPAGACHTSAVASVRRAVSAGATYRPWAGGSASVALAARLSGRTLAVSRACTAGAVVILAPGSRGALILARAVTRRGLPLVALPVQGAKLPELAAGCQWVPAPASWPWAAGLPQAAVFTCPQKLL